MHFSKDLIFNSISMFNWQIENQGLFSYPVYIAINEVLSSPTLNFKCEMLYCNEREVCKILETGGYISKFHTFLLILS